MTSSIPNNRVRIHLQEAYRQQAIHDIEQKVKRLSGLSDGRNSEGFSAMLGTGKYVTHSIISEDEFTALFYQAYFQNGLLSKIGHHAFVSKVKRALQGCKMDACPKLRKEFGDTDHTASFLSSPLASPLPARVKSKPFCDQKLVELGYTLTKIYQFYNQENNPVFQKLRYQRVSGADNHQEKTFLIRHQGTDNLWYAGRGSHPDYPYNLPEMMRDSKAPVIVCEGEKDADTAHVLGLLSVSVNNWKDCVGYFKKRDVILVPDNDEAGQKRAKAAQTILEPVTKSFLLLKLPDLAEKGDLTDWVEEGGTREEFEALIQLSRPETTRQSQDSEVDDLSDDSKTIISRARLSLILEKRNIEVAYNQLNDLIEINGLDGFKCFSDQAANRLRFDLWEYDRVRISKDIFHDIIADIALGNAYHPIKLYLNSLKWDGKPRVDGFFINLAGASDFPLIRSITQIWFIAAVRRIFEPGADFQELVVLEGSQGRGKSTAIRKLCPDTSWYSDDLPLNASPKTVVEQTFGKWIIEASELTGRNHDIRALKRFLSATTDRTRLAYERLTRDYPRQWIPIGTTNESEYLVDSTGNRRYWPIKIKEFDLDRLTPDYRDQLWAEAVHMHLRGLSLKLDPDLWESARREQAKRFNSDPWEDILRHLLPESSCRITVSSIPEALGIPQERRDRRTSNRVASIMRSLGYEKATARHPITGKVLKVWVLNDGGPVQKLTFTGPEDYRN
ncbi:MAG: VapE domain-containing protein [Methyloligellaceae bacterium]